MDTSHDDMLVSSTGTTNMMQLLAESYVRQKKYEEAEVLYRKVLALNRRLFGPDHIEVAMTLHNLAKVCEKQDRVEEAVEIRKRAAAILDK
jgi:tetratricopeptide (TPR) repeat protein